MIQTLDKAIDRVTAAIARSEKPHVHHTHGGHPLVYKNALLEGKFATHHLLPMFLIWQSYLRSQIPTDASVKKALQTARGQIIWRMAIRDKNTGQLLHEDQIPWQMLQPPIHQTRADTQSPDEWWNQQDVQDYFANVEPLFNETLSGLSQADLQDIYATLAEDFAYQNWLENSFLTDMQVLQLLDAHFNTETAVAAGQEFLDAAGIVGVFNINDPITNDYLRTMSGAYITKINYTTRDQAAKALWDGWMGIDGTPLSGDALANYLQLQMNAWRNQLQGMSDYRAKMIAITETARAETFGNYIAMLQSGVRQVQWVATTGACIVCEANVEQGPIPIMTPFPSGHFSPPSHPVCRCSIASWIDDTWNPNDWAWSPDPSYMDQLFNDPSFALWPNEMVDFTLPQYASLNPDTVGMVQWSDLPQAVQDVVTSDALGVIQRTLGVAASTAINIDDFAARLQDFIQSHKPSSTTSLTQAEQSYEIAGADASAMIPLTIDQILAGSPEVQTELTAREQKVLQELQATMDALAQEMDLSAYEGDIEDIERMATIRARLALLADELRWDEGKHPRGSNGRFVGGAGTNIPSPRVDAHGVSMPFSRAEAIKAWNEAPNHAIQGSVAQTKLVSINGEQYFMKTNVSSGQNARPILDMRNEAAVVASAKALGAQDVFVENAWHIQGGNTHYSISQVANGKTDLYVADPKLVATIPEETLQKALVSAYILGLSDRQPSNIVIDTTTGSLKNIDNGFAFGRTPVKGASPKLNNTAFVAMLVAKAMPTDTKLWSGDLWNATHHALTLDPKVMQSMLSQRDALMQTLQQYGLSQKELQFVTNRLNVLQNALDTGTPLHPINM